MRSIGRRINGSPTFFLFSRDRQSVHKGKRVPSSSYFLSFFLFFSPRGAVTPPPPRDRVNSAHSAGAAPREGPGEGTRGRDARNDELARLVCFFFLFSYPQHTIHPETTSGGSSFFPCFRSSAASSVRGLRSSRSLVSRSLVPIPSYARTHLAYILSRFVRFTAAAAAHHRDRLLGKRLSLANSPPRYPFQIKLTTPCPLHSAGSSHTTYVPRASELVATAERSPRLRSLALPPPPATAPFSRARARAQSRPARGPHPLAAAVAVFPTTLLCRPCPLTASLGLSLRSSLSRRRGGPVPPPPPPLPPSSPPLFSPRVSLSPSRRLSDYPHRRAVSLFLSLSSSH